MLEDLGGYLRGLWWRQHSYAKNYPAEAFTDARRVIEAALDRLGACQTVEQVRGVEGASTRAYFELFRKWNKSAFAFEERVKRGANDPLNVLLNLGYTMVTLELSGILEGAGLDPASAICTIPPMTGRRSPAIGWRNSVMCWWIAWC